MSSEGPDRPSRDDELFAHYVDRLVAGETLDIQQIRHDHPEISEAVIEQLETFLGITDDTFAMPGNTLGDFTLIRQIGRGGMGVVYEAWQTSLERHVALKILPAGVAADSRMTSRFMREARLSAKLSHPNVVAVHGFGVEQHTPYFAMEFIVGETLTQSLDRLRSKQQASGDSSVLDLHYYVKIARAFVGVADGLQHAHEKGITHRDVKPSNLMYDQTKVSERLPDGPLRLLDFGLARWDGHESLTRSGDLVGTVQYMSPEQASLARRDRVDFRTDIYSLGATLYEAITLHPPIQGTDVHDTLSRIISIEPTAPQKHDRRIPSDLSTILLKCLRKEPENRYASAGAVAQDLQRFINGEAIQARPQTGWERLTRVAWRRRWQIATASAVLLFVVLSVWLGNRSRNAERELRESRYEPQVRGAVRLMRKISRHVYMRNPLEVSIYPWGYKNLSPGDTENYLCNIKQVNTQPLSDAIVGLSKAIDEVPDRVDAYWYRARANVLLGKDRNAAISDLYRVIEMQDDNIAARFLLSSLLRLHGDRKASEFQFSEAERIARTGWQLHWLDAQRACQSWQWKQAAKAFKLARIRNEDASEPYIGWDLEIQQGRQICLQLDNDLGRAMFELPTLLKEWPDDHGLKVIYGTLLYANEGRRQEGIDVFEDLYNNEEDQSIRDEIAEIVCLQHGFHVQRVSDMPFDEGFVEEWMQKIEDPKARTFVEYRMALVGNEDKEEAFEILERATNEFPDDPWFPLARSNAKWNDEKATEFAEWAAEREKDLNAKRSKTKAHYYAQICHAFRLAYDEHHDPADVNARRDALEALEELKSIRPARTWESIYLGMAYGLLGKSEEANQIYDEVARRDLFPWVEHNRGDMLLRLAERTPLLEPRRTELLEASVAAQQKAIDQHPMAPFYRNQMNALWLLGRYGDLIAADEQLSTLPYRGTNAWIRAHVGLAYTYQGDLARAFAEHRKALDVVAERRDALDDMPGVMWLDNNLVDLLRWHPMEEFREQADGVAQDMERWMMRVTEESPADGVFAYKLLTLFEAYHAAGNEELAQDAASRLITALDGYDTSGYSDASPLARARDVLAPNLITFGCIDQKLAGASADEVDRRLEPFFQFAAEHDDAELQRRVRYAKARRLQIEGDAAAALDAFLEIEQPGSPSPEIDLRIAECLSDDDPVAAMRRACDGLERFPRHAALRSFCWQLLSRPDAEVSTPLHQALKESLDSSWVDAAELVKQQLEEHGVYRINCGSSLDEKVIVIEGSKWFADEFFFAGDGDALSSRFIPAEQHQAEVYESQRIFRDPLHSTYRIPVPSGTYQLSIHFAESYPIQYEIRRDDIRRRVFDIDVEGKHLRQDFEIVSEFGFTKGGFIEAPVTVNDGMLDISFVDKQWSPAVSGITIAVE